ncbi:hypothetical protein EON66_11755 [archaeon]|nr:MAG: hypothetical protein EON66_11755 [archaeon]
MNKSVTFIMSTAFIAGVAAVGAGMYWLSKHPARSGMPHDTMAHPTWEDYQAYYDDRRHMHNWLGYRDVPTGGPDRFAARSQERTSSSSGGGVAGAPARVGGGVVPPADTDSSNAGFEPRKRAVSDIYP